ncbi:MAG: TadE/TadG family type IV pilus assembly protein [Acidimicrobiia bacterium]
MKPTSRRRRDDDGLVVLEFAMIAPVLIMVLFGITEYGMAFRDKAHLTSAVRAGVRVGASDRNTRLADYDVLQAVRAATSGMTVEYVVVYKANSDVTGAMPVSCRTMTSQAGLCNVYTGAQMASLTTANFQNGSCTGEPDVSWCPTSRAIDLAAGRDYLGVFVQARRTFMSGEIPGGGVTFSEFAVMQLEPGG